jgi:hypothetical protein
MKFIELILATVALVAGVTAVFFSGIGFSSSPVPQEPSRHALLNPNPFALRGSAFGSLFSRLAEDDIDRVWHVGLEGEIHSAGNGWLARAREEKSRRTNPKPPGGAHATAIRRDLRQMLVNAFLLDPGSYTIYEALYLFLTSMDGIDQAEGEQRAGELSEFAIHWISGETEDPEPWLTAAAASINLHLSLGHSDSGPHRARTRPANDESLISNAAACLNRFDALWAESGAEGRRDLLSEERRNEINERRAFLGRLVAAWQKREKTQPHGTEAPSLDGK